MCGAPGQAAGAGCGVPTGEVSRCGRRLEGGRQAAVGAPSAPHSGGMVTPSLLSLLLPQRYLGERARLVPLCPYLLSREVPSGAFVLEAEETGAQRRKGTCQQPHSNVGAEPGFGPACFLHPTTLPPTPPAPCRLTPAFVVQSKENSKRSFKKIFIWLHLGSLIFPVAGDICAWGM